MTAGNNQTKNVETTTNVEDNNSGCGRRRVDDQCGG